MLLPFSWIRRHSSECMLAVAVLSSTLYSACSGDSGAHFADVIDGGDASAGGSDDGAGGKKSSGGGPASGGSGTAGKSGVKDSGPDAPVEGAGGSGGTTSEAGVIDSGTDGKSDASDDAMTSNTG